jgi:hypothetical protein
MGQTLTDNLVPVSSSSNQAALPSTAMIALPSTSGMENIHQKQLTVFKTLERMLKEHK